MKSRVIAVVMLAAVSCSFAKITVDWSTFGEVKNFGGGTLPVGAVAQLIYSPDAVMNTINGGTPFAPQGGDVLLGSFIFSGGDGYIGPLTVVNFIPAAGTLSAGSVSYGGDLTGSPVLAGAMVYTRVFNDGVTPTYYGQGGADTVLTEQFPSPTTPDLSDIAAAADFTLTTPIPEPGAGLLVLAGAAVAIFRRRRQQD